MCDDESCVLTCDADTSGATPVTYTWRSGETELPNGTSVELHITKVLLLLLLCFSDIRPTSGAKMTWRIINVTFTSYSGITTTTF